MFPVKDVSDADVAFGMASVAEAMMPPYADIPDEFKKMTNPWNQLFSDWFFQGLGSLKMTPKEDIDSMAAHKHLRAIMGSWAPKHEHKESGIAFLLSEWFHDAEWTVKGNDEIKRAP
jgi:hypothetical protein